MKHTKNVETPFMASLIFVLALGLGFLLSVPCGWARDIPKDAIIAIVNDDVITLKDLREYIAGLYSELKIENKSPEEIKQIMGDYEQKGLEKLIDDKLILTAANEKDMTIRDEPVDKKLKEIKGHYASEDDFVKAISSEGMTISDIKKKLMDQLKVRYLIDLEVRDKIFVNPQDVTDYYDQHKDEFVHKPQVNLQSIFVSFANRTKTDAADRAKEARAHMVAGEDFKEIFKTYSDADPVGRVEQGQMADNVEQVVFNLKLDEVSQPVEVGNGIYVFKVIGIDGGRTQGLQEVKDQIYNRIFEDQFEGKFKEWVSKLRDKAYIEIR